MANSELKEEIDELRAKIEKEADTVLSKERKKVKDKFLKNIEKHLSDMKIIAEEFRVANPDSNETSAIEKYSHKIYEGVAETVDLLQTPQNITLQSVNRFIDSVQKELETLEKNVFSKYIKLLDRKYAKRVKSLNKAYLRVLKDIDETRKFLINKYNTKASIEEGLWILDDILELEKRYLQLLEDLEMQQEGLAKLNEEAETVSSQIMELKNSPLLSEKKEVDAAFSNLQKNLDNSLSEIRKALRKFINKSSKSKKKIDVTLAKEIVTDAATAFANQSSVNGLKSLFSDILRLLESNEIEMKRDKKESAIKHLNSLIDGELESIWKQSRELKQKRENIATELKDLDLQGKIDKLQNKLEGIKRDMKRIIERELREAEKIIGEVEKLTERLKQNTGHTLTKSLPPIPEFVKNSASS